MIIMEIVGIVVVKNDALGWLYRRKAPYVLCHWKNHEFQMFRLWIMQSPRFQKVNPPIKICGFPISNYIKVTLKPIHSSHR